MPRTHQFLDTLTVPTTKIKPRFTPPTTSAASTTKAHPLVVIPGDVQHLHVKIRDGGTVRYSVVRREALIVGEGVGVDSGCVAQAVFS